MQKLQHQHASKAISMLITVQHLMRIKMAQDQLLACRVQKKKMKAVLLVEGCDVFK